MSANLLDEVVKGVLSENTALKTAITAAAEKYIGSDEFDKSVAQVIDRTVVDVIDNDDTIRDIMEETLKAKARDLMNEYVESAQGKKTILAAINTCIEEADDDWIWDAISETKLPELLAKQVMDAVKIQFSGKK